MKIYKTAITSIVLVAIFFLGFTTAYTIVIWRNITTTFLDWNPPPPENAIPIRVTYPESMVIVVGGEKETLLAITMLLTFNGTLAENTRIQTENASCLLYPTHSETVRTRNPHIVTVEIGFKQTAPWNLKNDIQQGNRLPDSFGFACAMFWHGIEEPNNESYFDLPYTYDVYFPVAGDYSPTIFIAYENQTVEYTYSSIQLHVLSTSEVNGERINRINLGLTFAFLGFSYIGVIALLYELLKEEKEDNQFPINIIITPENNAVFPTKNKPKTISFSSARQDSEGIPNADNSEKSTTHKPNTESASPK